MSSYKYYSWISKSKSKNKSQASKFRDTNTDEIKKSIENFDPKKASQKSDMNANITRKIVAFLQNVYIVVSMLLFVLQSSIMNSKRQILFLYIKRCQNYLKKIIDLSVFFQISSRFMKDAYMIECQNFLIIYFQSISFVFERVTAHNPAFQL